MILPEYIRYVGRMKQPLQKMDIYNPSMYVVGDSEKYELCLIILTPGSFCHAYNYIKHSNARSVKIFFPSLRPEFISDIMNLYMSLKNIIPVKWVFPEVYNHYSFSMGHEKCGTYIHPIDSKISISYIKNEKVDRLYDLVVKNEEGIHYFSLYMTDRTCTELFYCKQYTFIHVSKSAPIYGGMNYDSLIEMNRKFRKKLVPFDFTSIEEYFLFTGKQNHPCANKPAPKPPTPKPQHPCDKEENKWYPGHPPIEINGNPGRPVESDDRHSKDSNVDTVESPIETPKGDEIDAENYII